MQIRKGLDRHPAPALAGAGALSGASLLACSASLPWPPHLTGASLAPSRAPPRPAGVLFEFAGQLAVYGDVDRKLTRCMARMKEWVESVEDVQEELAAAAANMADIRAGEGDCGGGLWGCRLRMDEGRRTQDPAFGGMVSLPACILPSWASACAASGARRSAGASEAAAGGGCTV